MPDSAFYLSSEIKMESSNLLVDKMQSSFEFKMRVLEESPRALSPNRRIFVTTASLNSKTIQLILFILLRKVIFSFV